MTRSSGMSALLHLAGLYGVQTAYYDVSHRRCQASPEALMAVLGKLEGPVSSIQHAVSALRERRQAVRERMLEPVAVAWDGQPCFVDVHLASPVADGALTGHLVLETGEEVTLPWQGSDLPVLASAEVEGVRYVTKRLQLPGDLAHGYHQLTLEVAGRSARTLIISAPSKAYAPPGGERSWGVFLPLYALHSQRSWGSGDFSDLASLAEWTAGMGGGVVATLPILATFLDEPFEPSPYSPLSRLFDNEFYLDVGRIPELERCPSAQAILASASFRDSLEALRGSPLVDYRRQMALKRRVLEELSRCLFGTASDRVGDLARFVEAHPLIEDYARFRATCEKRHACWRSWPEALRRGRLKQGDYAEEVKRYHLYAQWLTHQQMRDLDVGVRQKGLKLYLDLPLGVHPDGFDTWKNQDIFVQDCSVGAAPDTVFTRGQNWWFPPLHPEKLRAHQYAYYIDYLRHHLQHADILRIDHMMGLHRLFWIPDGVDTSDGLYVRYRAEEFYAILALESHRTETLIVGEDLGTVPPAVRPAMHRHGLHRMYVVEYELMADSRKGLPAVPPGALASLNTHDMPTFAAFWQGLDIEDRFRLGLLDISTARTERKARRRLRQAMVSFLRKEGWLRQGSPTPQAVLEACLGFLSSGRAGVVLVNLEDAWQELRPQNVPGTAQERPNWRRRAQYQFETFSGMPPVIDLLRHIDSLRRQRKDV